MNLSEESIKHLEQKAFIRGIERAAEIVRITSTTAAIRLDEEVEKLTDKLEGEQYEGGLNFPPEK